MNRVRRSRRGSLLVVTLWLVTILSVLAVGVGRYLSTELRLTKYRLARERAKALARSGVYLGMQRLAEDVQQQTGKPYDWLGDEYWAYPSRDNSEQPRVWIVDLLAEGQDVTALTGKITVEMQDEERRLTLNTEGHDPLLAIALKQLLADYPGIAEAIIDYQDSDDEGSDTGVVPPYVPKNGPIQAREELWELPSVKQLEASRLADLQRLLLQETTVSTTGTINMNTADEAVLRAILEPAAPSNPALAQAILDFRWDPGETSDPAQGNRFVGLSPEVKTEGAGTLDQGVKDALTQVMVGPLKDILSVQSTHFRIVSDGQTTNPRTTYRVTAIVERHATTEPMVELNGEKFHILSWREG